MDPRLQKGRTKHTRLKVLGLIALVLVVCPLVPMWIPLTRPTQEHLCRGQLMGIAKAIQLWTSWEQESRFAHAGTNRDGSKHEWLVTTNRFDSYASGDLIAASNYLGATKILVCPSDPAKKPAVDFQHLGPENVTYQISLKFDGSESFPQDILIRCPIHGNALYGDGSVRSEDRR